VGRVVERSRLSAPDYLAWERLQSLRHEFFDGEVFAMAGGSLRHNALSSNVTAALHAALHGQGCIVLSSDQRVGMTDGERYVYPDVTVVCGAVALIAGTNDVVANPTILVEVLSSSTEQYDRGLKWEGYQRLESLTDYVLVSQSEPRIEHFRRDRDASWLYRSAGPADHVALSTGVTLAVDTIFAGVLALAGD
jgi:Uma2 family endonuclease